MFKRLLIASEFHSDAVASAAKGIAFAVSCHAEVVFCCVLPRLRLPTADLPDNEWADQWDSLDDGRDRAEQLLRQFQEMAAGFDVMSRSVIAVGDDPVRAILDTAAAEHCDLIVVSSEGSNAVVRLLTGSVVTGLVSASSVPVMACPPARSSGNPRCVELIQRLLILLEDNVQSDSALTRGLELAKGLKADLLIAHITSPDVVTLIEASTLPMMSSEPIAAEMRARSRLLVESASLMATRMGLPVRGLSLQPGTTARDVARLAMDQACHLVITSHNGSNALMRLLTGSLIPGLITWASVPLLICRNGQDPSKR